MLNYSDDQAKSKPTALEGADTAFSKPDSKLKITLVAAGGSTLIAVLGLLGYIPGLKLLGSIGSTFIPMAPSTALSFIVLGGIMLITTYRPPSNRSLNIFTFLATLVALYGALEVVGFFLGMDLNFEEQLIPEFGTLGEIPIARMSMPTGALFLLTGLATLALILRRQMPQQRVVLEQLSSGLGAVILITSLVFCGAYLFGSPLLYGRGSTIPMALTTALAFLALGVSIIAKTGGKGPFIWLLKLPFQTNDKPFSAPRRLIVLVSVMVGVALISMSILLTILFRHQFRGQEVQLLTSAQNQVLIIQTIYEHNLTRAVDIKDEHPDYDPLLVTLQEIASAHVHIRELGQSIEFTLAQQKGDSIVFLQTNRAVESLLSVPVPMNSTRAEPQRRALRGETGTMVGPDYRGKEVLAAYSFVKELNLGVVVKIDMAEIRAPFIRATFTGIIITGIIIIIGSLVFIWIGNPVIRRLEDHSKNLQNEISQRKQVEKVLSESESKYRTLFEAVPDAIFFFDPVTFEILNANEATSIIYGYDRDELKGMSCLKFSAEIDKSKNVATKILKDGQASADYRHHKNKDGSDLYVSLTGHKISVNGHDLFFSVCRDITERKQAEEALAQSDSLRELLLDIITHDLKNPAGVIYALSETAQKDLPENKILEAIYSSSRRLMEVLNQTTTLSQAAFGETIPKKSLSLNTLIKEIVDEFASALSTAELEMMVAETPDVIINANPLIAEVFKNYISNAIKYASDGKRIVIETVIEDQAVVVRVSDFGKTIAKADREQVFQRRVQLEDGKERGRGLGLAIVKRIAEAHGGEVWVEPNTPKGNSFCLRIPL